MLTILSLYDYSGNWSQPYREAGYNVIQVDLKHGQDCRLLTLPVVPIHGILAAPPCTVFTRSAQGARARDKERGTYTPKLLEALSLVDCVYRLAAVCNPVFWAMENPAGILPRYLGAYTHKFNPCDYGGYLDPPGDAYTKLTTLYGRFNIPIPKPVTPNRSCPQGSWLQRLGGSSEKTKELRSATPIGFAKAFFLANP